LVKHGYGVWVWGTLVAEGIGADDYDYDVTSEFEGIDDWMDGWMA
jgi:hypothetical protein